MLTAKVAMRNAVTRVRKTIAAASRLFIFKLNNDNLNIFISHVRESRVLVGISASTISKKGESTGYNIIFADESTERKIENFNKLNSLPDDEIEKLSHPIKVTTERNTLIYRNTLRKLVSDHFSVSLSKNVFALSRAARVKKLPPVVAFRKGIKTHHFGKNILPLEKMRHSINLRLAFKGPLIMVILMSGISIPITPISPL